MKKTVRIPVGEPWTFVNSQPLPGNDADIVASMSSKDDLTSYACSLPGLEYSATYFNLGERLLKSAGSAGGLDALHPIAQMARNTKAGLGIEFNKIIVTQ